MRVKKSPKVVVAASIALLMAGGVAFAYWTTTGAGVGEASTASDATRLEIIQTSPITGLTPGGTAKAISGTFHNPNAFAATVAGVTATVSSVEPSTCAVDNFDITGTAVVTPASIPPGNNQGAWSGLSIQLLDKTTNQDACKNVRVNLAYTITTAPVVAPAATLVGGLLTVNYTNPALNGTYNMAYLTDGTVNFLGYETRAYLPGQFNAGVFTGSHQVTEFPVIVGQSYTFGVAPLGTPTSAGASFTLQVTAK